MAQDEYTWAEWLDLVIKLCPIESQRKGLGSSGSDLFNSLVRQAVIQLQLVIDEFRFGHETIYHPNDLVVEGMAWRGVKPPSSKIRDASLFKVEDDECVGRFFAVDFPWANRMDLVAGKIAVNDSDCRICIDPQGYTFYIYPTPPEDECWHLSVFWDGTKLDFQDDDLVPFTEMMAGAVADFVKAHSAVDAEDNGQKYQLHMNAFNSAKPRLYLDAKERRETKGRP